MTTRAADTLQPSLPYSTPATGVLTSDTTNVSDGDTVTIGSFVYTFKTALTDPAVPFEVLIGADSDGSLGNLVKAINLTGVAGTDYGVGTTINTVVSAGAVAANAFTVTAKSTSAANNTVATTEASTHLSWGHTTLWGGDGGTMNEITLSNGMTVYSEPIDVSAYNELIAFLKVYTQAGTSPTLDVSFEFSPTPNAADFVATGDAMTQVTTGTTTTFKRITGNFGRYVRAKIVIAGTNPKYKLSLSILGKS